MSLEPVRLDHCDSCSLSRIVGHPISECPQCQPKEYAAAFSELRRQSATTYVLGYDCYSDTIYVWAAGVIAGIRGQVDRMNRSRQSDTLVARITELEAENHTLLAENARMRRRLDGPR